MKTLLAVLAVLGLFSYTIARADKCWTKITYTTGWNASCENPCSSGCVWVEQEFQTGRYFTCNCTVGVPGGACCHVGWREVEGGGWEVDADGFCSNPFFFCFSGSECVESDVDIEGGIQVVPSCIN